MTEPPKRDALNYVTKRRSESILQDPIDIRMSNGKVISEPRRPLSIPPRQQPDNTRVAGRKK